MNFKIVHIISSLDVGGCEKTLYDLLNFDKSKKTKTLIISLNTGGYYKKKLEQSGYKVCSLNIKKNKVINIFLFIKLILNFKPDIIQGWMYHGNFFALIAKAILFKKTTLFWNIRQTLYDIKYEKKNTRIFIFMGKIFSNFPKKILCNSQTSILQHTKYGYSNNFQLVRNGIDTNKFKIDSNSGENFRKKYNIDENAYCIGLIARYHPMKDHNFFVKNILKVINKKNVMVVMIGRDVKKKKNEIIKIVPNNLINQFILIDEYENINEVLNSLNVICITSRWGEGMSNIIIEAMSTGLNCISSDIGDNKFLIQNFGSTFAVGNNKFFIHLLKEYINLKSSYKKKSKIIRDHIIKNYSLNSMFKNYSYIYKTIDKN